MARYVPDGSSDVCDPEAIVGDLVVIFKIIDKARRALAQKWGCRAAGVLPAIILSLIKKAPLRSGHEFPRGAAIVGVIGLVVAG